MSEQNTPTGGEHNRLVPVADFDRLLAAASLLVERADDAGVRLAVVLQNGYSFQQLPGDLAPQQLETFGKILESTFAASHAKLAVAAYVLPRIRDRNVQLPLIDAMLRESKNEAVQALVGEDAAAIVSQTKSEAGISTDILQFRGDGSYFTGHTSALDSMRLLVHLNKVAKDTSYRDFVCDALGNNTTRYGVRNAFPKTDTEVHLLNKTGDYYGHDDPEVGEAVHHDVGVIFTRRSEETSRTGRSVLYSITSTTTHKPRSVVADQLITLFGEKLVQAVGGKPKRAIGRRAVASVGPTLLMTRRG